MYLLLLETHRDVLH